MMEAERRPTGIKSKDNQAKPISKETWLWHYERLYQSDLNDRLQTEDHGKIQALPRIPGVGLYKTVQH
jgi:hypothetical protein